MALQRFRRYLFVEKLNCEDAASFLNKMIRFPGTCQIFLQQNIKIKKLHLDFSHVAFSDVVAAIFGTADESSLINNPQTLSTATLQTNNIFAERQRRRIPPMFIRTTCSCFPVRLNSSTNNYGHVSLVPGLFILFLWRNYPKGTCVFAVRTGIWFTVY